MADDELGAEAYCPDGFVTTQAYLLVLEQLTEARAEVARRDTTIAAQQPVVDAARTLLEHYPDTEQPIPGGSMWLDDLASTLTELDHSAALSAPVEAGTPAEPARKPCPGSGSQVISAKGYTRMWCAVCEADVGPWSWESPWPAAPEHYREEAGTPAAEPAPDTEHASVSLHRPDGPRGSVDATCKCGAWATVLTDAEARAWWDQHKAAALAGAGVPTGLVPLVPAGDLQMLREALCGAQASLGSWKPTGDLMRQATVWMQRLGQLIAAIDVHRPLGADGKHGGRHTATCGCEDAGTGTPTEPSFRDRIAGVLNLPESASDQQIIGAAFNAYSAAHPSGPTEPASGPRADWSSSWAELTGYVQQAADDHIQLDPARMGEYMVELKRQALAPVRDWMNATFAGTALAPTEPADDTAECDDCGHPRADHPDDQACRAVLRPLWAPDDECWCGRYVAALAGPADDTTREATDV